MDFKHSYQSFLIARLQLYFEVVFVFQETLAMTSDHRVSRGYIP
jgi:hypothetical protein